MALSWGRPAHWRTPKIDHPHKLSALAQQVRSEGVVPRKKEKEDRSCFPDGMKLPKKWSITLRGQTERGKGERKVGERQETSREP